MQLLGRMSTARQLPSRRHGISRTWPVLVALLAGTVSVSLSGFAFSFVGARLTERRVLHSVVASPRPLSSSVARNLFISGSNLLNPQVYLREDFVSKQLERMRLSLKKGANVRILDLEPVDPRYWSYLKPAGVAWTIEAFYCLVSGKKQQGKEAAKVEEDTMKKQAEDLKTTVKYPQWDGRRAKLPDQSIHMVMVADDAISRLGKKLIAPAFKELHRLLKNKGRVFIIATEEDEQALGFRLDVGQADALEEYGFELRTAQRGPGIKRVVGCLTKLEKGGERTKVTVDANDIASALFN